MPGNEPHYYWDACVPLAYIQDEEDRALLIQAMLIEAENGRYELSTSVLSLTEVAFVEVEKHSGHLDDATVDRIDGLWQPPSPLVAVEFFPQIAIGARNLIRDAVTRDWSLKPPDAIHLATAHHLQVDEFHTYDNKLTKWGELLGFEMKEPAPVEMPLL